MRKLLPRKKTADDLFRKLINLLYGQCQKCGSPDRKQVAHLASRGYYPTRWYELNAVILCAGCHMYFTHHPLEWDDWCYGWLGKEVWDELKFVAKETGTKTNYKELNSYLHERINDLQV